MRERMRSGLILVVWVILAAIGVVASVVFVVNHIF